MRLATWNVNSLAVRLPQVLDWLATQSPDVLALQETKLIDERFPHEAFAAAGWQAQCFGQKTYNGVALVSRAPMADVVRNIPGFEDEQARVIAATFGTLRVVGAYFPNGQEPGSEKFAYKMRWQDALREWLRGELAAHPRLLLMDEPFGALDEITRQRLNGELLRLCTLANWTVVFVTHNVFEAVYLSTRILVMSARPGRIIAEVSVPLPHPRVPEIRTDPEYTRIVREVVSLLGSAAESGEED